MKDFDWHAFGEMIRVARERKKLTQEELGGRVRVGRTSITGIESGHQHPPIDLICRLLSELDLKIALPDWNKSMYRITSLQRQIDKLQGELEELLS